MAIANRENVYINVESLGVPQAVSQLKEILNPLELATKRIQDFKKVSTGLSFPGVSNSFDKIDKDTEKFIKQQKEFQKQSIDTQKQLAEMLDNIDDRMARSKFFSLIKGGASLFGSFFSVKNLPAFLTGLASAKSTLDDFMKTLRVDIGGGIVGGLKGASKEATALAGVLKEKTGESISSVVSEMKKFGEQLKTNAVNSIKLKKEWDNLPFFLEDKPEQGYFDHFIRRLPQDGKNFIDQVKAIFNRTKTEIAKGSAEVERNLAVESLKGISDNQIVQSFAKIVEGSEQATDAVVVLSKALPMIGSSLGANMPVIAQIFKFLLTGFDPIISTLFKTVKEVGKTLGTLLSNVGNLLKQVPLSFWLKAANQGFAQMIALAGKATTAFAGLAKKLLLNPFALVAGGIAAAVYGLKEFAESCWDDIKAFDKLHPEITTVIDEMDELKIGTEATSLALSSISGKALNDTFMPIVKEATTTIRNITDSFKQWLALLTSGDFSNAFKKLGYDWGNFSAKVFGTVTTIGESFENLFGVKNGYFKKASDTWAEVSYNAGKTSDAIFKQSEIGKQYDDELKLAEEYLRNQAKEAEKTKKNLAGAKNELKEFTNILSNLTIVNNGDSFRIWDTKILGDFDTLKENYQQQLEELAKADEYTEEEKDRAKLAIEEDYLNKSRELQLANARAVGDNEYIVAQELANKRIEIQKEQEAERQRLAEERAAAEQALIDQLIAKQQEQLEAWVQKQKEQLEWVNSYVTGPLSDGIADVLASAIEGTEDLGTKIFDTLYSIAKNIFTDSISNLLNAALLACMNQFESNSKLGLPGLAIAAGASATIMGIMAGLKAKMQPPKKAKMAVGGYVSNGMVKGAYSGDSVEALLQPGERVLSKEETKAYDKGYKQQNQVVNINVSINGGFDKNTITTEVRQYLIPEIKRALGQGYNLNPA